MKSKLLFPLALCAIAALLSSGCATQPTHNGKITNVLGGLVTIETGDYSDPPPAAMVIDGKTFSSATPTGTSVSTFWGLTKYTNY